MSLPGPRAILDEVRLGVMVLTRLPVGRIAGPVPAVGATVWTWPLVGLMVGAISALCLWLGTTFGLPPGPARVLAILAAVLVTGALHEDGLADLADGLGGGHDRARALDIMRDSRIGSYGALAIGFSLALRITALTSLTPCAALCGLVALGAASRAVMPVALWLMPPARPDGLGRAAGSVSAARVAAAVAIGLAALLPFGPGQALRIALVMTLAALALGTFARRRIGGQTGDVLGALQQVAELAGWLTLASLG